jgi:rubrerythrin
MIFDFNADEIFQIGVQIETNGQRFYKTIAKNSSDPSVQKLFLDLSKWESQHIELFKKLKQRLPDSAKRGDRFFGEKPRLEVTSNVLKQAYEMGLGKKTKLFFNWIIDVMAAGIPRRPWTESGARCGGTTI